MPEVVFQGFLQSDTLVADGINVDGEPIPRLRPRVSRPRRRAARLDCIDGLTISSLTFLRICRPAVLSVRQDEGSLVGRMVGLALVDPPNHGMAPRTEIFSLDPLVGPPIGGGRGLGIRIGHTSTVVGLRCAFYFIV